MFLRTCLFFCLFALTNMGITASDAPSKDAPPAVAPTGVPSNPVAPNSPVAPSEATTEPSPEPPPAAQETYQPPFPQREELFQPPNVNRSTNARQDSGEVALKGFVDIGSGLRVLLSINGRVKQLAVGDSTAGIEVIQIDPPKVTLQRGRVRWTDTLFEVRPVPAGEAVQNSEDRSASLNPPAADEIPYHAEPAAASVEPGQSVGQGSP